MVQGDTSTACAMALSAFNHGKKVIHLEAGLRSSNPKDPYPEEMNRQIISRIADINLCPTNFNKENLLKENVSGEIYVVGNTGLDNISRDNCEYNDQVLITMHRRDNHHNMDRWFEELEKVANKYPNIEFMIPLHPNPDVQKHKHIFKKVKVIEPMKHDDLIDYVKECKFVISDSGGLQEECSYLNKKIIVCRKTTERPESIGIHSFMCENPELLDSLVDNINNDCEVNAECPYGDGKSWNKVVSALTKNNLVDSNCKIDETEEIIETRETDERDETDATKIFIKECEQIILIPIGGLGTRFKENDYRKPKALINVFGEPIVFHLIHNLNINDRTMIYIVYNNEYHSYRFEDMLKKRFPNICFRFHHLQSNTEGAAETINIALKRLNAVNDLPVICLDSDNFYTENIMQKWNKQNAILYFEDYSTKPLYSYVELNSCCKVTNIREKEKISDNACCGGYGFSSYKQLLEYTQCIIDEKFKFKNEYYTSSCIKRMLDHKIPFYGVKISKTNYHCLGTPIQLRQFYNNMPNVSCRDYQKKIEILKFCFDLDNTLVTYPKIPNDYSSVEPIKKTIDYVKYLKSFGHVIIISTARRMRTHQGNVGKVIQDIGKVTLDTLEKFNIPYDELHFGKPHADFYIDDNAVSAYDNLEKELGFYQDSIKPRDFNTVEKTSIEVYTKRSNDLAGEIYYYSNIPNVIKDMFPLFIDFDHNNTWYSIEKINGLTLSNLYLSELLTPTILESVMSSIRRIQNVKIMEEANINIYENYKNKLEQRYSNYDYTRFPNAHEKYKRIYKRLDMYEKSNKGKISCIHGDTVFTNILINHQEKIKFIDMRGQQGKVLTIQGDWLYDWAKFYQSLIGYDEILLDKEVNVRYKKNIISEFEKLFIDWFSIEDFENLKDITDSLLFTLIPLHDNDKCIKYYNLITI